MGETGVLVRGLREAISYRDERKACQLINTARREGVILLPGDLLEEAMLSNMEHTAMELMTLHNNNDSCVEDKVLQLACRRAMSDLIRSVTDLEKRIAGIRSKKGGPSLLQTTMSVCNQRLEGTTNISPRTRRRQETLVQGKVRQLMRTLVGQGDDANQVMLDGSGRTALHLMCQSPPDLSTVRYLLLYGAEPNQKDSLGRTPLIIVLQQKMSSEETVNLFRIVEELLSAGADANIFYESCDQLYWPLHLAISRHSARVASLLVRNGANVNAVDESGMSALFYAIFTAPVDRLTILKTLLSKKDLQLDLKVKDGHTVLHYAAKLKELADQVTEHILRLRPESRRFLVSFTREGSLPLHDALRSWNFETARLLLENGSPAYHAVHLQGGNHLSCLQLACTSHIRSQHRKKHLQMMSLFATLFRRGVLSTTFTCKTCFKKVDCLLVHSVHGAFKNQLDAVNFSAFSSDKEALMTLRFFIDQDIHLHMNWRARYSLHLDIESNPHLKAMASDISQSLALGGSPPTLKQACRRTIRESLSTQMTVASSGECDLNLLCCALPLPTVHQKYLCVVPPDIKPG